MTITPQRLRMILVATAGNLGIWILTAFFATSEFYRRAIVIGGNVAWEDVLVIQLVTALNWAMFTPLVVLIAQQLPLRAPHRLRNLLAILAFIPYLAVARAAMGGAVLNLGEGYPVSKEMVKLSIGIRTHRYAATLAVIFLIYNLVDAQREAAERERKRVRAQTLLARTGIDDLRARLQPQFALCMLRHIGSVMRDAPKTADALIVTLSAILRRSMARGVDEWIPLADELEHLDRCLDLCRAGGRFPLAARYVADDEVLALRVPALVLQPVIERVVLDLTAGDAGGSVEVRCARDGDFACIEVVHVANGAPVKTALRISSEEAAA